MTLIDYINLRMPKLSKNLKPVVETITLPIVQPVVLNVSKELILQDSLKLIDRRLQQKIAKGQIQIIKSISTPQKLQDCSLYRQSLKKLKDQNLKLTQKRQKQFIAAHKQLQQYQQQTQARQSQLQLMWRQQKRRRLCLKLAQDEQLKQIRKQTFLQSSRRLNQLQKGQKLYQKIQKNYRSTSQIVKFQEQTKLDQLKIRAKPIDYEELRQHQRFFIKMRQQVRSLHDQQLKNKLKNAVFKRQSKGKFARIIYDQRQKQRQQYLQKINQPRQRLNKIIKYQELVKINHMPPIKSHPQQIQSQQPPVLVNTGRHLGRLYLKQLHQSLANLPLKIEKPVQKSVPKAERKNYLTKRQDYQYSDLKKKIFERRASCCEQKQELQKLIGQLQRDDEQILRQMKLQKYRQEQVDCEAICESIEKKLIILKRI